MRPCWGLCRVLDVLQFRLGQGRLGGMAQDVLVKVALVVDLVDELIDAGCELRRGALERLRADNLAVVDYELLVERGCLDISWDS